MLRADLVRAWLLRPQFIAVIAAVIAFGVMAPEFLGPGNLANIVKQSAFVGVAAIGMTFVLLTGGIDLSVGSIMFLASIVAGAAMNQFGAPAPLALLIAVATGALAGLFNAFFIVRLKIAPFVVTLATLFAFRGVGTWITESRQLDLPREASMMWLAAPVGVPLPILVFVLVALAAALFLALTLPGRQLYAIGHDAAGAAKAGVDVGRVSGLAYVASGACAALAGFALVGQIGRLDQSFGEGQELIVIAAAVLGGASVFGGVGGAFGAVVGALLIQTITVGLVFTGVNLYLQPMILGLVVFLAVLLDSVRSTPSGKAHP